MLRVERDARCQQIPHLGNISEQVLVIFIPLQVLVFHTPTYPLLDQVNGRHEMSFHSLNHRDLDLLIRQLLASFHDAHNRRVQGALPITLNSRLSVLRLLFLISYSVRSIAA